MTARILVPVLCLLFAAAGQLAGQGWERRHQNINQLGTESGAIKTLALPGGDFLFLQNENNGNAPAPADFSLTRTSPAGAWLWTKRFDFGGHEIAADVIRTGDGGFLVLYHTSVFVSPGNVSLSPPTLLKLDAQGDVVFQKSPDMAPLSASWVLDGYVLAENTAGFWLAGVAGGIQNQTLHNGFLAHYSLQGDLLGANLVSATDLFWLEGMVADADGTFTCSGAAYGQNTLARREWRVVKMAADGSQRIWENAFSEPPGVDVHFNAMKIIAAPDGGHVVYGSRNSGAFLAKIDAQGAKTWEKLHSLTQNFAWFTAGGAASGGDGYWLTAHDGTYIPRIVLVRTDLAGNVQSQRHFGIPWAYHDGKHLTPLPDGGCLIGGSQTTPVPNNYAPKPYLIRTDAAGNSFASMLAGTVKTDFDDDCLPEMDTLSYGILVHAWQNGQIVGGAQVGLAGEWAMNVDTGNFVVKVQPPNAAYNFCPDSLLVQALPNDTVGGLDFTDFYNPLPLDSVFGTVFEDVDGDCLRDSFETAYPGWTVSMRIGGILLNTTTDALGNYVFADLSNFTNVTGGWVLAESDPPGDGLKCQPTCGERLLGFANGQTVFNADFGVRCDSLPPCPGMEVSIATNRLRPCLSSVYNVSYCNEGLLTAENASIVLTFDSILQVVSASIPWASVSGNAYTWELGNVPTEQCGSFNVEVAVPCDAPLGQTFCVEAHAFPDTSCAMFGPGWDGSKIAVTGDCQQDSVRFTLRNLGPGNMQNALEYIVIEDNVLLRNAPFQLPAGGEMQLAFAANGNFYRVSTQNPGGFPGQNFPVAWVEGCLGSGLPGPLSLGFANQFPFGDAEPWLDVFCLPVVNSYDPNDKTGFPLGVSPQRFIEPNTELEYVVRFQNTGTAEALNIEIRDTLPTAFLELASVRPGASSHPYEFDLQGNSTVVFRFPNINLPDSNANEAASQGFVSFRVRQKTDLPIGTQIRNQAAIFFDFNAPVITNRTLHTLGEDFLSAVHFPGFFAGAALEIQPNPTNGRTRVFVKTTAPGKNRRLRVLDVLGRAVLENTFSGDAAEFDASGLRPGAYLLEVLENGKSVGRGRLVKI